MSVVLLIAVAAILGGVIVVAIGRGGELVRFAADVSPVELEIVTAADVALIRPPSALFGYNSQVTDDVLSAIARTVTERDVEIASLRQKLADLQEQTELRSAPGAATAADIRPAGSLPARSRPAGSLPVRSRPAGSLPVRSRPADDRAADNWAADSSAGDSQSAESGATAAGRPLPVRRTGAGHPGTPRTPAAWSAWQSARPGQPRPPAPGPVSGPETDPDDDSRAGPEPDGTGQAR